MKVMLAQSAGFCFGVNRAVELVEQAEFPKELVLNYSTNELMSWLEKRKVAI